MLRRASDFHPCSDGNATTKPQRFQFGELQNGKERVV